MRHGVDEIFRGKIPKEGKARGSIIDLQHLALRGGVFPHNTREGEEDEIKTRLAYKRFLKSLPKYKPFRIRKNHASRYEKTHKTIKRIAILCSFAFLRSRRFFSPYYVCAYTFFNMAKVSQWRIEYIFFCMRNCRIPNSYIPYGSATVKIDQLVCD